MSGKMTDAEVVGRMACVEVAEGHDNYIALVRELRRALASEQKQAEQIRALVEALEFVQKSSVNERTWNEVTGEVDDMKAIVAAALAKAGRKP
jgi:hypothetical protein